MRVDLELSGQFAPAKDLDRELVAPHHSSGDQRLRGKRPIEIERRDGVEIHNLPGGCVDVGKTAQVRHALLDRELTALESRANAAAGAGFLTLVALAGGLALAGTWTATNPLAIAVGALIR